MKTRASLGAAAIVLALSALVFVTTTNAKEKKKTTLTKQKCFENCQIGFTKCNQTGAGVNGEHCDTTCCQKELGDCQTILCADAPAE